MARRRQADVLMRAIAMMQPFCQQCAPRSLLAHTQERCTTRAHSMMQNRDQKRTMARASGYRISSGPRFFTPLHAASQLLATGWVKTV